MHRITIILEIVLIFVLPVLWFVFKLGFWDQRLIVFELFVGLIVILAIAQKMNFRAMGFRLDTLFPSARLLLPGTLLTVLIIVALYKLGIGSHYFFDDWWKNSFFLYYVLLGAVSQEFVYRGYLLMKLKSIIRSPFAIIVISALLFAWLHVLRDSGYVVLGSFLFSLYLTWAYLKQPNILASSLAHALVGSVVIILGYM